MTVVQEEYRGFCICLEQDVYAEDPLAWTTPAERSAWFALSHRRYSLPYEIDTPNDEYESWTALARAVTVPGGELAGKVYQFVHWYEHSGIAVSLRDDETGQGWDAGIAGVVFGDSTDAIAEAFADWQAYTEGEVYHLVIQAPDGIEVENIRGMDGYENAIGYARVIIDNNADLTRTEYIERYGRCHAPQAQEQHNYGRRTRASKVLSEFARRSAAEAATDQPVRGTVAGRRKE